MKIAFFLLASVFNRASAGCVQHQSIGICAACLTDDQCGKGMFCCTNHHFCTPDSQTGCGVDSSTSPDWPKKWQDPTCGSSDAQPVPSLKESNKCRTTNAFLWFLGSDKYFYYLRGPECQQKCVDDPLCMEASACENCNGVTCQLYYEPQGLVTACNDLVDDRFPDEANPQRHWKKTPAPSLTDSMEKSDRCLSDEMMKPFETSDKKEVYKSDYECMKLCEEDSNCVEANNAPLINGYTCFLFYKHQQLTVPCTTPMEGSPQSYFIKKGVRGAQEFSWMGSVSTQQPAVFFIVLMGSAVVVSVVLVGRALGRSAHGQSAREALISDGE